MVARDRILELQFENSHSFVLRDIATNTAGQEFYLDMSNPLMAYEDGGALFVNISLMFDRYPTAVGIKLGAGINAIGEQGYLRSPFDRDFTFIYDIDILNNVAYGLSLPLDVDSFPNLLITFDTLADNFLIYDSSNFNSPLFTIPFSDIVNGQLATNLLINSVDFSFSIDGTFFQFDSSYPKNVIFNLVDYFGVHGGYVVPECPDCPDTSTFSYQSLDGNFDTYPNGTVVQIYPSSRDYIVESSFFFRNDTNQFVVMYWIVDSFGKRVSVPHNYLVIPTVPEGA